MPSKMIKQFELFIDYMTLLKDDSGVNALWLEPIAPGKWSLQELVCHLWNWDVYSIDKMIPLIKNNAQLPEFVDIDSYNKVAIEKAKTFTSVDSLIDAFVETREKMIKLLVEIFDPNIRFTIGEGKRQYSIDSYVKIFVDHDEHHKMQIEELLERV